MTMDSFTTFSKIKQSKWLSKWAFNNFICICIAFKLLLYVQFYGFFVILLFLNYSADDHEIQHSGKYSSWVGCRKEIKKKSSGSGTDDKIVLFTFLLEIIKKSCDSAFLWQ